MKDKNILYFTRTMELGGTEKVILQLCEIMKDRVNKIIVCSSGGVNVEKLTKVGIKHYTIPDIEKKDMKTIIQVFNIVLKILKEENVSVIHTHHRMAAFYTRIFSFIKKFIFINTVHNTFYDKKFLTKFSIGKANNIAVGERVRDNICDFYGISKKNVKVIYNAVKPFEDNLVPIEILKKYRDDGYFLIGNIGRLSEQKGMKYFVEAAKLVLEEHKNVKFFIIGDGEDRDILNELILKLKLQNSVILLGYRDDIQNLMSQLDLIVLSSLWEGLPLTPIEAFSVGKTIVATNVDGTVEIVNDKINGFLVESKNSIEIAKKIILILKNNNLKKEFENNAKNNYIKKFSFNQYSKNIYNYYLNIISK